MYCSIIGVMRPASPGTASPAPAGAPFWSVSSTTAGRALVMAPTFSRRRTGFHRPPTSYAQLLCGVVSMDAIVDIAQPPEHGRLALHQLGAGRFLAGLRLGEVFPGLALGGEHFLALVLLGLERCFVARAGFEFGARQLFQLGGGRFAKEFMAPGFGDGHEFAP